MRLIGRVADGSTDTSASVILLKDLEREVRAESLVLIKSGGSDVLGILRRGLGRNEFLSRSSYRPEVAYLRHGGEPSAAKEVYSFDIIIIGEVADGRIRGNRKIIAPGSPVYIFDDENPLELFLVKSAKKLSWMRAHIEGKDWPVPADAFYIPYHVGVFGSTGSGKSYFTRHVLIPFYVQNGYRAIVLDWSGEDYAPYFESVSMREIAADESSILDYISGMTENFYRNEAVRSAFEEFLQGWPEFVKGRSELEVYEELKKFIQESLRRISREDWRRSAERAFQRFLRKVKPEDLSPFMGSMNVSEIIDSGQVTVIDMSGFSNDAKLSLFLSLAEELKRRMVRGRSMNIALIIDEAPQYCPYRPEGIQQRATEEIKNLVALGRKHHLNVTLIAQGIAGEIGINAAIRRNLNTNFYGRLHPLDAAGEGGAKEWLGPYGITPDYLLTLEEGRFYFSGAMNPSPVPLLVTFEVS